MKKISRKQAENIIEEQFSDWEGGVLYGGLCYHLRNTGLQQAFKNHWYFLNLGGDKAQAAQYLDYVSFKDRGVYGFLDLLTLHLWVRHDFK
jgi:hypothetical protein